MKKIYLLLICMLGLMSVRAQNDCATAIAIPSVPFSSGALTTCGSADNYPAGSYFNVNYGGGEDYVFSLNVTTAPVSYNITLGGSAVWKIASVHTACPPTAGNAVSGVVTGSGSTGTGVVTFPTNGTYYIFVDTWPTPTCGAFTLDITPQAAMTYVSSTTTQSSTAAVTGGTLNQQIIRVQVVTTGQLSPLNLTSLSFNTNGSTNPADIASAKVYYTGTSTTFATTTQFGSTVTNPNGSFAVTGSQALAGGTTNTTNYFWLVYDISCSATAANVVDAEATAIQLDATAYTPTVTAPAGTRAITAATNTVATTQPTTAVVAVGSTDNQVLRVQVTSCANAAVTAINFNTTGSTNPSTDISSAKVYFTTTTTFATTTLFGSAVASPNGAFIVNGSQALVSGTGYFWLVYDVPGTAGAGNVLDASVESLVVNAATVIPTTPNPTGTRTIVVPPSNDNCSTPTALTVNADLNCTVSTNGTTLNATQSSEVPVPTCSATGINDDVWYTFVATAVNHNIVLSAATNTTVINVYSGSCGALTNLGCLTSASGAINGVLPTTIGTTYYIRVYSSVATATTSTNFTLCINTPPPPPANDVCSGAIVIPPTGPFPYLTGATTNTYASATGDPAASCQANTNRGVWYSFTPSTTGFYTISTCQSDAPLSTITDNVMAIFTSAAGCTGPFTQLASGCDDDACNTLANQAVISNVTLTAGTTYYILVYGFSTNLGDVQLRISAPVACATPTNVAVVSGSLTASGANISWTGTGTYILEYGPTGFTPGTGATAGAGTIINPATSPQAIGGLTASTAYDVYVRQDCTGTGSGFSPNSTVVTFTTLAPPPANDNCGTATAIASLPYTFNQTDGSGATQTAFVSACAAGMNDGLWYKFTGTGCSVTIAVTPSSWDAEIGVYTGSCGTFTCQTSADAAGSGGVETVSFTSVSGTEYFINVGHYSGSTNSAEGAFSISVSCAAPVVNDNCAGAITIGVVPVSGSTLGATTSLPQGTCDPDTQNPNDVWYQFTTTAAGTAVVSVSNPTGDIVLEAFTGTCGGTLTSAGCSDNSTLAETLTITGLTAGQTVYVRVYGYEEANANFNIAATGAALPVAIEYFRGTKQNGKNVLDWKVSCYNSPTVNLTIERSADGRNFAPIRSTTETAARCLQPFNYDDVAPLSGINYYRLKSVDVDGKVAYSNVVALLNREKGFEIVALSPNPVKDQAILNVTSAQSTIMEIVVTDLNGKQLSKQRVSLIAGNNQLPLSLGKLPAGTYQVTGLTADGQAKSTRFVKQ
ncbi:MAG: T9SS type A sorting domain-containing protein [Sphingobacteriaceae bacterium]|nr:MAG: T9SS type A sorting domain-containing protein [Sphingobacteriaceae bacterium]